MILIPSNWICRCFFFLILLSSNGFLAVSTSVDTNLKLSTCLIILLIWICHRSIWIWIYKRLFSLSTILFLSIRIRNCRCFFFRRTEFITYHSYFCRFDFEFEIVVDSTVVELNFPPFLFLLIWIWTWICRCYYFCLTELSRRFYFCWFEFELEFVDVTTFV
jgi:hypothetical protein